MGCAIPPVGANIWVEFEGGDTDYPIWSGCFWGTGEVPASPAVADMKMLKTGSVTLTLNDLPVFAIGFGISFLSAVVVVKAFLGFVSKHSFVPFALYRILLGGFMLWWLLTR